MEVSSASTRGENPALPLPPSDAVVPPARRNDSKLRAEKTISELSNEDEARLITRFVEVLGGTYKRTAGATVEDDYRRFKMELGRELGKPSEFPPTPSEVSTRLEALAAYRSAVENFHCLPPEFVAYLARVGASDGLYGDPNSARLNDKECAAKLEQECVRLIEEAQKLGKQPPVAALACTFAPATINDHKQGGTKAQKKNDNESDGKHVDEIYLCTCTDKISKTVRSALLVHGTPTSLDLEKLLYLAVMDPLPSGKAPRKQVCMVCIFEAS